MSQPPYPPQPPQGGPYPGPQQPYRGPQQPPYQPQPGQQPGQPGQQQWAPYQQGQPQPGQPQPQPGGGRDRVDRRKPGGGGKGVLAGVLAGGLLLGALGGLGGAWAFDALDDDAESVQVGGGDVDTSELDPLDLVSVNVVAREVLPVVVKIDARDARGGGGSGSGIVISDDGEILTNHHVIASAIDGGSITVSFDDGSVAEAEVVGSDPGTDTALLKAEGVSDLDVATLGSSDLSEVGQAVVAVGSPYGLQATVTAGIISSLHRPIVMPQQDDVTRRVVYGAIQTDAAINPGNSGGALVNMAGEVVGINASIELARNSSGTGGDLGSIGIGYAIPISDVLPIVEQMRAGETPTHPRMGVVAEDAEYTVGVPSGALITELESGGPADEAGIEEDDVITALDDLHTGSSDALIATMYSYRPGDTATVTLVRDDEEMTVEITFGSDDE
ncbi:S1C family serine protease [Nocardioides pacificus]